MIHKKMDTVFTTVLIGMGRKISGLAQWRHLRCSFLVWLLRSQPTWTRYRRLGKGPLPFFTTWLMQAECLQRNRASVIGALRDPFPPVLATVFVPSTHLAIFDSSCELKISLISLFFPSTPKICFTCSVTLRLLSLRRHFSTTTPAKATCVHLRTRKSLKMSIWKW